MRGWVELSHIHGFDPPRLVVLVTRCNFVTKKEVRWRCAALNIRSTLVVALCALFRCKWGCHMPKGFVHVKRHTAPSGPGPGSDQCKRDVVRASSACRDGLSKHQEWERRRTPAPMPKMRRPPARVPRSSGRHSVRSRAAWSPPRVRYAPSLETDQRGMLFVVSAPGDGDHLVKSAIFGGVNVKAGAKI